MLRVLCHDRRPKVIDFETEHAVSHVWKNVSAEAKVQLLVVIAVMVVIAIMVVIVQELVNQMLCPDPVKRIGIERILAHSWIPSNLVETM